MIRIGQKLENTSYKHRSCAYIIIEREEDDQVAIVTDGMYFFLLGGGIEDGENELQGLSREVIEESGYTIKDVRFFDRICAYDFHPVRGYLDVTAAVYIGRFDKKVAEPIEPDHALLWVDPKEYQDRLSQVYHNYILCKYIGLKPIAIQRFENDK